MRNRNLNRVQFLEELHRECARNFEPEVTSAVVMEVDAHLTESIQARLELGDSLQDAEINAVNSFHHPKNFVRSMGKVHHDEQGHDRPLLAIGVALLCWLAFYIEIAPKHITWLVGPLGILLLGAAVLIRTMQLGALRLGTIRILALAAVLVIGVIAPLRTVNLWAYDGMGYMPVQMAREMLSEQDGYIRSSLTVGNWATTYVGDISEVTKYDTEPAKRALAAPLWERWVANSSQTVPSLIFCLGLILLAHLVPVAVRRRMSYSIRRPESA